MIFTDTLYKRVLRGFDMSLAISTLEYLQKMIATLPQDLMSVVITQIDTEKFADSLINKFPEILAKFIAG